MIFVEVSHRQMKKVDFRQFGTVLAKIALRIYVDEDTQRYLELLDPVDYFVRLANDYLFSVV